MKFLLASGNHCPYFPSQVRLLKSQMIILSVLTILAVLLVVVFFFPVAISILVWFVVGLIAGFVGPYFIPECPKFTKVQSILIGLAGSFIGGFLGTVTGYDLGLLGSIAGAILVIFLYVQIKRRGIL